MTLGDILDGAFKLLRATFLPAVVLVLLVFGPLQLVASFLARDLLAAPFDLVVDPTAQPAALPLDQIGPLIGQAVVGLLSLFVAPLITGALTWLAAERDTGREPTWREALAVGWRRYGATLGATLLVLLGLLLSGVVLGIPAVLLVVVFPPAGIVLLLAVGIGLAVGYVALLYLVIPPAVLEGQGPVGAIRRTIGLIRSRPLPILGTAALAGIVISFVTSSLTFAFGVVTLVAGPFAWVFNALGSTLGQVIALPVGANVALLLYTDARIRTEGFDIQLLAARMGPPR